MYKLFKNIGDFTPHLTLSYANTGGRMPNQTPAIANYILPVIGPTVYDDLAADSENMVTTPLLTMVRAAAAPLIFYNQLPYIHTALTETGLKNATTETFTGAYRYQYEDIRQALENDGLAALERLFIYLTENPPVGWAASEAAKRLNRNLIKTGTDFINYQYLHQPHRTFYALQPVMQEVEDLFIKTTIGADTLAYLKDLSAPTDPEKTVIEYLKKAIANFTVYKAITKLAVRIRPEGLTVILGGADRAQQGEQTATIQQLSALKEDAYKDGNAYLDRAQVYLNTTASALIFPLFFASPFYINPLSTPYDANNYNNGIYAF